MDCIRTSELHVMQDGFRLSPREMWDMWGFLCDPATNGRFNRGSLASHDPKRISLIAIIVTEDGKMWIRDGLHRAAVVSMFGRTLLPDEYVVQEMSYDKFMEINMEKGWITPFNPRTEVRRADFHQFKQMVMDHVLISQDPREYILSHRTDYCLKRTSEHTLHAYCKDVWARWAKLQAQEEDWMVA